MFRTALRRRRLLSREGSFRNILHFSIHLKDAIPKYPSFVAASSRNIVRLNYLHLGHLQLTSFML